MFARGAHLVMVDINKEKLESKWWPFGRRAEMPMPSPHRYPDYNLVGLAVALARETLRRSGYSRTIVQEAA